MECNATFTKRKNGAAFTLVEILVAVGIGGILLAALMQVIFYTGRSFAALMNYTELDKYSRNALDQMIYKIRQADELKSFTTNQLVFSYFKTNELVYEYLPEKRVLTETVDGRTKILLKGCDD